MISNMPAQKDFSKVPAGPSFRSVFNRSHAHKLTYDSGYLVPFFIDEVLPGDAADVRANIFARLSSPLVHPIMDNIHIDTFYFFVPFRLVWEHWEEFMGAREEKYDPNDPPSETDYIIPTYNPAEVAEGDLADYYGIGQFSNGSGTADFNALFFRGYNLIWNEWFRDENLQDPVTVDTSDGPDTTSYELLKRGKRHDYFTSCLPFAQKGEEVGISLTGQADVWGNGYGLGLTDGTVKMGPYEKATAGLDMSMSVQGYNLPLGTVFTPGQTATSDSAVGIVTKNQGGTPATNNSGLIADLEGVSGISINDLRNSIAVQQVLEMDARSGTRYTEIIQSYFGVVNQDARLQRPEYLGGSSKMININPVTQTSQSDVTNEQYQGNQAAHGTFGCRSGYSKSFPEHGMVIGLASVRADLTYQSGIPRMFNRSTRFDYYLPQFANLGEQEVLNREIFFTNNTGNDNGVFGYQERWAEMRYYPSRISGQFDSSATLSLDVWHLSQVFNNTPVLGDTFIEENPPLSRVLTVTEVDEEPVHEILQDTWIEYKHARPLPVYSVPGLRRL